MIDPFTKEFDLMCYVKDTKVMTGNCDYKKVADKFGEPLLKKCILNKRVIFVDKKGNLDWTDFGKFCMFG
jgi:hypothetical protein